jgi:hypothetical protein
VVSATSQSAEVPARSKRADALRNQQTLLAAAAAVFVTSGVNAPIREITGKNHDHLLVGKSCSA